MSDPSSRLNAALSGRYTIKRELGQGGMATVYLAEDLKHKRKVALKVLKPELAAIVGAERFFSEIETTASLQHPNILPLFDSGEADGFLYYVMPYVEGESLRQRLDREHQLPVAEAVGLARDVAGALEHAHGQGIIHRDIKPANILLSGGKPLVADFGIALAVSTAGGGRLTETGLSLGTPHYMSPEQATADRDPGPPSDVYGLGCVLYESLAGEPPFTGGTAQAVLGKIISAEAPRARMTRRAVPEHVDAVILRALEKVPADRFGSAEEFAAALGDPSFRHGGPVVGMGARRGWLADPRTWALMAVVAVLAGIQLVRGGSVASTGEQVVTRFAIPMTPEELGRSAIGSNGFLQLSPDGRWLAWGGEGGGLLVRDLEGLDPTTVPGTEDFHFRNVDRLTFSPDGEQIAFTGGGSNEEISRIKVVPRAGGAPRLLTDSAMEELDWSDDGWIYFPRRHADRSLGLGRIRPAGGSIEDLPLGDLEGDVRSPVALPESRGVLFRLGGLGGSVAGYDLRSGTAKLFPRIPLAAFSRAVFDPVTGHLILSDSGEGSIAVPFDLEAFEVTGDPFPLPFGVMDLTSDGTALAYDGDLRNPSSLAVVLRPGQPPEFLPNTPRGRVQRPIPSPDGRRFAFQHYDPSGSDITRTPWVYELPEGPPIRIAAEGAPLAWHPDGTRVLIDHSATDFGTPAPDADSLFWVRADGVGDPEFVWSGPRVIKAGVTPQGSVVVGTQSGPITVVEPSGESRVLENSEYTPVGASVSPDGVWVAYQSLRAGEPHVWIRRSDGSGAPIRISLGIGLVPFWSEDGRRLFYWGASPPNRVLMVATMDGDRVAGREEVDVEVSQEGGPEGMLSGDSVFIGTQRGEAEEDVRVVIVRNWRTEFVRFLEELGGGSE